MRLNLVVVSLSQDSHKGMETSYQIWSDDGKNWHITDTTNTVHKYYAWLNTSKKEVEEMVEDFNN